ncbi:hypothetical protein EV356DRAFT_571497 [Viridothelium virens]|uniref:Uncharacterized protein n=1 Tax=Viridothelium virens TaxID=1048519 RepID=A0A6A6GTG2_VIRVR|nr:hypothetical protein EV356DRAFT_571497 [Viridothelium virens]
MEPQIHLSASVSLSSIALSSLTLENYKETPIELTLTLRLPKLAEPITLYLVNHFLSPVARSYTSTCILESASTNSRVPFSIVHSLRSQTAMINLGSVENELLTLNPDKPLTKAIKLGLVDISPSFDIEDLSTNYRPDPKRRLWLCRTKLEKLQPGTTHRVVTRQALDFPFHMNWWPSGDLESVKRKLGAGGREVVVTLLGQGLRKGQGWK